MTKEDILRLRDTAEQTKVQFKERVTRDNKYDVSCEMVAQSNSRELLWHKTYKAYCHLLWDENFTYQ